MNNLMVKAKGIIAKKSGKAMLKIRKHSPEILFAAGLAGFAGTVVVACRATLKADEILENHRAKMRDIEEAKEIAKIDAEAALEYDDELYALDRRNQTIKTAVEMFKAYAPVVTLAGLSIGCFVASRNILHRRYIGATAAANAAIEVLKMYRGRVVEELGEDMDQHFRYGTEKRIVKEDVVDENGKKHKEEIVEKHTEIPLPSTSAVFFDESNPNWHPSPQVSLMFLRSQQRYWNDVLHTRGHVFLNEVLYELGFDHTPEGSVVGWLEGHGDNCIDFGLYDENKENVRNFINGKADAILLEFNHDGPIWDKI